MRRGPTRTEHSPSTSPHHRGAVRSGLSDGSMQKTFHEAMRQRRTSLPANGLLLPKPIIPGSNVSEARGMVVDLLSQKDLPGQVVACLRAVSHLLNPHTPANVHPFGNDFGLPSVVEDPYSGEQLIVSGAAKPRVSNITFSTVTSATGLPTIAAEPSRPRSSNYWKPESDREASSSGAGTSTSENSASIRQAATRKERLVKSGSLVDTLVTTRDGRQFDTKELDEDRELQMVSDWNLPIFELAYRHPKTVLSKLTYTIFKHADLHRIFKISPIKFFNFFHALERGYHEIPYHNRVHAADVLHGCYYLTCHGVRPQFGPSASPDSLLPQPTQPARSLASCMSNLEVLALYTAAAMHDYDHPGQTNAYLVAVEDAKAILYNDRSVLENHHAAESWKLISHPENFFIENLDAAEIKRFRYLVLEYILATDLKQHFEIIMAFNEKVAEMELTNESDRLLLAKMLIKMADINSPTKPFTLHRMWTDRICEEFYEQGDQERRRGMTITPYMDRGEPQVAKLQDSFIAHVVSPLTVALNEAGLLPILPGLVEPEMMINLKHNHQKWLQEIDAANVNSVAGLNNGVIEEESTASSPDARSGSPADESEAEDQVQLCTIVEREEEYV